MVAQAKSVLTIVSAPFASRDRFRARPCPAHSGMAPVQFNPECAPQRRTMAIDSTPNAISARRPSRGAVTSALYAAPASGPLDRHVESSTWQTRCLSMPPTRKRPGSWWCVVRRSRNSTSSPLTGSSCEAISTSPRSPGSNRRSRRPSSNTAATGTASSPSAKSIPTTTRSRSPTVRLCSRRRPRPPARRSARKSAAATAAAGRAPKRPRPTRPSRRPPIAGEGEGEDAGDGPESTSAEAFEEVRGGD